KGVSGFIGPGDAGGVLERYGARVPYVLYVGAFQARKNLINLIDAFVLARTRLTNLQLVLVGSSLWAYPDLAERLKRQTDHGVLVLGYVADADLAALYGGAT